LRRDRRGLERESPRRKDSFFPTVFDVVDPVTNITEISIGVDVFALTVSQMDLLSRFGCHHFVFAIVTTLECETDERLATEEKTRNRRRK
jgi:hypothetical protein